MKFEITPPENASFDNIAISPDGKWLAFTAATGGKVQLWVRALDSTEAKVLPNTEGARFPFWSPDSRWIGFFAANKLKKIEASGASSQTLCDAIAPTGGTWNHDDVIVFARGWLFRVSALGGDVTVGEIAAGAGSVALVNGFRNMALLLGLLIGHVDASLQLLLVLGQLQLFLLPSIMRVAYRRLGLVPGGGKPA